MGGCGNVAQQQAVAAECRIKVQLDLLPHFKTRCSALVRSHVVGDAPADVSPAGSLA